MTEKKEFYSYVNALLDCMRVPYIHIPNRTFKSKLRNQRMGKEPDYMFMYNGVFYMREYGIKSRNLRQKAEQFDYMKKWGVHGANIKLIFTQEEMVKDFTEMGMIV